MGFFEIKSILLLCEEGVYPYSARLEDEAKLGAKIMLKEDVLNVFDRGYFNFLFYNNYRLKIGTVKIHEKIV
ncbi:hypothetical protein CAI16_11395 [Virgibacillus dokdonensis]|uniref:Uncharacterized protein n=1 Tax=Virgibacillus dokdonensis TaxID=302167 RepID=A0A3E0WR98_9BACI|nr:hypothetical protein CAI16_11395 [Virgibacillus dokdonensis]